MGKTTKESLIRTTNPSTKTEISKWNAKTLHKMIAVATENGPRWQGHGCDPQTSMVALRAGFSPHFSFPAGFPLRARATRGSYGNDLIGRNSAHRERNSLLATR